MNLRHGADWGVPGPLAAGAPVVGDDAALAALVATVVTDDGSTTERDLVTGTAPIEIGLLGGDLHRTLGSPRHTAAELVAGEGMRMPVDVGEVELTRPDGEIQRRWFVAHLLAVQTRSPLPVIGVPRGSPAPFATDTLVVMNAAFRGRDDLGPRAHPGDGLLDVTRGRLAAAERRRARRRMPAGAHLPHPALHTSRVREMAVDFERPAVVEIDGRRDGRALAVALRCRSGILTVVV